MAGVDVVKGIVGMVRPSTLLATGAVTAFGFLLGGQGTLRALGRSIAVTTTAVAAANTYNDVVDVGADAVNRPDRALPSGHLSRGGARRLTAVLAAACCLAALGLGLPLAVWAVVALVVGLLYSAAVQRVMIAGEVVVAVLFANAVLYGAAASGSLTPHQTLVAVEVFWFVLGREFLKGVPDVAGDRLAGKETLAARWGAPGASRLFVTCAAMSSFSAALAVVVGHACILHLFVLMVTVTVPSAVVGRAFSQGPNRTRSLQLLDHTRVIWAAGLCAALVLFRC